MLEHPGYMITLVFFTLYSLFGDDFRSAFTTKSQDPFFDALMFICLIVFSSEVIVASIFTEGYIFGFYFWLDLMATLSIVMDINWLFQKFTQNSDFSVSNAEQASSLARSGRAARIGTRAARISRVIRLVRLVRIVKLYKSGQVALNLEKSDEFEKLMEKRRNRIQPETNPEDEDEKSPKNVEFDQKETRVGKRLNEST